MMNDNIPASLSQDNSLPELMLTSGILLSQETTDLSRKCAGVKSECRDQIGGEKINSNTFLFEPCAVAAATVVNCRERKMS